MAWYYLLWIATSTLSFLTMFFGYAVHVAVEAEGESPGINSSLYFAILLILVIAAAWPLWWVYLFIKKLLNHG